jgi:very-short-patch-repair endonuclease
MTYTILNNEYNMFYGAPPDIFKKAKALRDNPTEAEKVLWEKLRLKQLGVKFRRQHPINIYIADFYCHEKKLVVEVDGGYHLTSDQKEYDELRTENIKEYGIEVIRFKNEEVLNEIDKVVKEIRDVIAHRTHNP